ncbi:ABC transporter ATP-binding protein [Desulfocurvus vexinensis]|uniref:ABC transporter ATP-binding protein n=1 Tax=Desulfocurvus vexinensis TaxID=399548 RepID=UPI00048F245B|nr:ABC transporter ATP-binding protein [Desulfocurvus vexinensis]
MIRAEAVCCGYGRVEVLHGVSLDVPCGGVTGLLGPNGSGKTTLVLALAGVLPLSGGRVAVAGADEAARADMHALPARRRAQLVACVPQRLDMAFALRCSTLVLMGRFAHTSALAEPGEADRRIAREAMRATGVEHLWDRPADAVSGGELQRVLLARALAQQAPAMLLDEPSASLDLAAAIRLFDLLRALAGQGRAVLCAMHDLNLAALYCDALVFLKDGRVAAAGPVKDVFHERTLSDIYGTDIRVGAHPLTGAPQAHFVPGAGPGAGPGGAAGGGPGPGGDHGR